MRPDIPRFRVIDCMISCAGFERITDSVIRQISGGKGGYVCFVNVHTAVTARKDKELRGIINNSHISAADGKPLAVIGRLQRIRDVQHAPGPDYLPYLLSQGGGLRHYFFGSTEDTLAALVNSVQHRYPDAIIAGWFSPPFTVQTTAEEKRIIEIINTARPDVIWVGLGAPKQEYWMSKNWEKLRPAILMGVGAAFDFHAGIKKRAPFWCQKLGIEWLYRLFQEPARLWRRYAVTNTLFLYYVGKEFLSNNFLGSRPPHNTD